METAGDTLSAFQNQLVFLGTGTSSGVPVLGCECSVCTSSDPRDRRTRIAALLRTRPHSDCEWDYLLIDTSIDLRQQLLREKAPPVTRVAYTHAHVDHFFGLDELRGIQFKTRKPIEVFASPQVLDSLNRVYTHLFDPAVQKGGGILHVVTREIHERFRAGNLEVEPLPLFHGTLAIFGYRWGSLAFMTDCSCIPDETWERLRGVDTLVLGMLRKTPHPTHFNLDQALEIVHRLHPRKTYFVHMTHDLGHSETNAELPPGVELAYDGLRLDLDGFDPIGWKRD